MTGDCCHSITLHASLWVDLVDWILCCMIEMCRDLHERSFIPSCKHPRKSFVESYLV